MQPLTPRSSQPDGLITLDREPNLFWYGVWKNISITVWEGTATRVALDRIERIGLARMKANPERRSIVHVASASSGLPSSDVRAAFSEAAKRWASTTGCVCVVIEHAGFAASALRSAMTGIQLVAGADFPLRAHRSLEEAVPWLAENHAQTTNVEVDASELLQALVAARGHCR